MFVRNLLSAVLIGFVPVSAAYAAGGHGEPIPSQDWSFSGPFGEYDKASLQRGLKIYREVCASCHSLKRIYFRNLEALGYDEGQVKSIAAEYTVMNKEPNDEGDMFDRAGEPKDHFPSPFANDNAAKFANGGALPPDLSLMTKARPNGSNYVASLLMGYTDAPEGEEMSDTQYWNKYFPGHKISMAPPLSSGQVSYEDGSPETLEQYAKDIAHFLTWAADPYMEDRKRAGFRVIMFLLIFAGVMFSVKKKLWTKLH